jgi:ketosteroid isomerase-like protein
MKKSVFCQWLAVLLFFSAFISWASISIREAAAMGKSMNAPAPSNDPVAVEAIRQLERDMGDAMVAGDIQTLSEIYADDFATDGSAGKVVTKETLLTDFKSFHDKLEWFENGPIDVQVFGNIAMAQGGVEEKRSRDGKDTSGQFLWQDVLRRQAGKWVVWRSAAARVVQADSANARSQNPADVTTIKKFENDLGDAMVANNIEKINEAYADDWATVGSSGKIFNKESLLGDFKSGNYKIFSFEDGPMNVQVLGGVAVVQTSVNEKKSQDGKDISGQYVFMDLLKKRAGKWVIVRTLSARVS